MKYALLAILAVTLCGCQGLKQGDSQQQQQSTPGHMQAGGWEFILQYDSAHNGYLESNIGAGNTAGTYKNADGNSQLFVLDSATYLADPNAGGGYELKSGPFALTLTVSSTQQLQATLTQNGGSPITLTGTVGSAGDTITGTFDDGIGGTGSFTAAVAGSLDGSYSTSNFTINESISGNVISESSANGSGDYDLSPPVGNVAVLQSDVPEGGDGSTVFWNNSGVCNGAQCTLWRDVSSGNVWVLMNNPDADPANQVVGLLGPGK